MGQRPGPSNHDHAHPCRARRTRVCNEAVVTRPDHEPPGAAGDELRRSCLDQALVDGVRTARCPQRAAGREVPADLQRKMRVDGDVDEVARFPVSELEVPVEDRLGRRAVRLGIADQVLEVHQVQRPGGRSRLGSLPSCRTSQAGGSTCSRVCKEGATITSV